MVGVAPRANGSEGMSRLLKPRNVSALVLSFLVGICVVLARPAHAQFAYGSYGDDAARQTLELRIVDATNAIRVRYGLTHLTANHLLRMAARSHSEEMLRLAYFSHTSPTRGEETVSDRVFNAGSTEVEVGENLAVYEGYSLEDIANRVVEDWMNSPGHRANLLKKSYNAIGLGVAFEGRRCLVTQVFAASRVALQPVTPRLQGGQVVARFVGQVRGRVREVGVFDGQNPLARATVGYDGSFDVSVTLRANSGVHALNVGILAGRGHGTSTFEIYNVVQVNTNAVAAR